MSFNLSGGSPTYNSSGLFGSSLNGGTPSCANPFPASDVFTIEARLKMSTPNLTGIIALGAAGTMYWQTDNGIITAKYGSGGTEKTIVGSGAARIDDAAWHHVEMDFSASGCVLYVDGAVAGSNATTATAAGVTTSATFALRSFIGGYNWIGELDEVAIWSTTRHTAAFTPSASAIPNTTAGLVALWHLDGNLTDSAGVALPATAVTATPPTSGTVGAASAPWNVGADGTITGTIVVTPSDGGAGGTFTPATASISTGTPTVSMTYAAASAGAKTISWTNNGGLANPANSTFTAATVDTIPPTFSSAQVTNANPNVILVTMSEALAASVPPTSAFTVSGGRTVTAVGAATGATFPVTVSSAYTFSDAITIAYTAPGSNPRLQDSAPTPNITASFAAQAVTNNIVNPANNALTGHAASVAFSPYNWDVQASTAKTVNAGAYFKTVFGGTSCALVFDATNLAGTNGPQISYRVDRHGPWTTVPVAASVTIAIPSDTADYAAKGGHLLEVLVKSTSETQQRWYAPQATAVILTGIMLDVGKSISAPPALPLKLLFYGDSITEGVRTVNSTATYDTDRNDAAQCWSLEVARILGAEVGNVGFGATGFKSSGSSVPALTVTYASLVDGVARSFAANPDAIIINECTNDSGSVTAAAITVINGLLAATTTTKIILLTPFNQSHAGELQAAKAGCSVPARCFVVDTTGFFTVANSSDSLHPYGIENIVHIAPLVANAIRTILAGAATLTARTVTINLGTAAGPAASLTGLHVAFYDEASPELQTTARYQSATQTTDSSGNLTFTVMSTLASGGSGSITIKGAGVHYNGPVSVA
jgi:hypothetical protein